MAFDGLVIANVVNELNNKIIDSRITRIAQPEKDEIVLTIKGFRAQYRLLLSAGASLPLLYLTEENKQNPLTAPNFCMLLRKHLNNARILEITQPGMERIVQFKIEHRDELGDLCIKYLVIELMGKHSNIIFCDEDFTIVDSIIRVNQFMSSVRQVLPGYKYFIPNTMDKFNPLDTNRNQFFNHINDKDIPIFKAIYTSFTGISPLIAREISYRSNLDIKLTINDLTESEGELLKDSFFNLMDTIKDNKFNPNIVFNKDKPIAFSGVSLNQYKDYDKTSYDSVSHMLEEYFSLKSTHERIHQKSSDLRRIIATAIDRTSKKYGLQERQLKDTVGRDKFKVYGELIAAYGYGLEPGAKSLVAVNFYNDEEITIPLKENLTPIENSNRYFKRYNKLKRTREALTVLIKETKSELDHLESIQASLDMILKEEDLSALRDELVEFGYVKRKGRDGKKKNAKDTRSKSKPHHYISSDGFDIYVGKNNYQNDNLSFKIANNSDWWFHSKDIPGSHVIIKTQGQDLPHSSIEEGARLAAYYSSGRSSGKVEIDYTTRKNLRKPRGAKPGFVIYDNHSSILADTNINDIKEVTL